MADTIAIRRQIRSVRSTRRITQAMQLVAASKMRAATAAAEATRRYREHLDDVLGQIAADPDWKLHPMVQPKSGKTRIVLIGSDRGLVGPYHTRLEAAFRRELESANASRQHRDDASLKPTLKQATETSIIGKKEAAIAARLGATVVERHPGPGATPNIWEVGMIAHRLLSQYERGEIARLVVISTKFYSALRQEPEVQTLLPLSEQEASQTVSPKLEPTSEAAITDIIRRWVTAKLHDALSNAFASEQAMQMLAMQNATNNAGDMIDDLTLAYNTARQAAITQELAEISGGVAALSS